MRKKPASLILLSMVFSVCIAQQWNSYSPTSGFDINTVDIVKPGHIAIGGGRESHDSIQVMFMSLDYGVTWNENAHDGFLSWNKSIAFSDTLNGIGVGYQGRIIKTNDAGANWGNSVFPTSHDLNKIVNVSPLIYYAVGGHEGNDSMQTIVKTVDGGTNWNVIYNVPGPCLKSVYFLTALKGFAVGDSGVILETVNGGGVWNSIPAPVQRNFNAIEFINSDTGFIAGGNEIFRTILRTDNGGTSWYLLNENTGGSLRDISFADISEGYIVGDSSTVLKTVDRGHTWTSQQISSNLNGNEVFSAVKFYSKNYGVVAGKGGVVYVYTGWPVDIFTLGATIIDSQQASILASVNTHGLPSAIQFFYSTDSTFTTFSYTQVQSITTDTFFPVSRLLNNLLPNTRYYYFVSNGSKTGDTLSFYTGSEYPVFSTEVGDVVGSNTLLLRGDIHGVALAGNIKFEYGTTPLLGNSIVASPASINDTSNHSITALLTPVQSYTTYYYRLRAEIAGDTVYGNIFTLGSIFHILETLLPTYVSDTIATLNGMEQGFPGAVSLNFECKTEQGPLLQTIPINYPESADTNFIMSILNGLGPQQLYYYRLKAQTGSGIYYGKWLGFYTGSKDSVIQTLAAQNVSSNSATLEGMVNHFPVGTILSFEYGTDSSLTNIINASPATTSDTFRHTFSATLSGVPVYTTYYYRLKAFTPNGATVYGGIRMVFIGNNEIPNWDFQYWNINTYTMPTGWNLYSKNFSRVPGRTGGYALNLTGLNLSMMGFPWDNSPGLSFRGGVPFTGRPDSVCLYVKGSLTPGDTGTLLLYLHQGSTRVAQNFFPLPVNNSNVFQRISFPINYQSSLNPDSLILGFVSTAAGSNPLPGSQNNTMTVDDIAFIPATAPVYNGDFETWFDYQQELPDDWYCATFFGVDSNLPFQPTITKTMFSPPGDFAAELQNNFIPSIGVMRARLGFNKEGLFTGDQQPTFPVYCKHVSLNGYYETFPVNHDSAGIMVTMYHQGHSIGIGQWFVTDSVTSFTPFEIPIQYYADSAAIPDSADIQIFGTSPWAHEAGGQSKFIIDKLRFDGFASGIDDWSIKPVRFDENGLKIFPNPSNDNMILEISEAVKEESLIELFSLNGQKQKELKMSAGDVRSSFSVTDLEPGFYLLRWTNNKTAVSKKIVVTR